VFVHISPYIIWYDWTYLNTFSFEEIPWDSSGGANGLGTELLQQRWCQGGVAMLSSETTFTATVDNLRLKLEMVWLRQSWNILEHQCIPILNNVRWQATLSSTEHKQKDSWEQRWDNAELPNIRRNISAMYRFKSSLPPGWVKSSRKFAHCGVTWCYESNMCSKSRGPRRENLSKSTFRFWRILCRVNDFDPNFTRGNYKRGALQSIRATNKLYQTVQTAQPSCLIAIKQQLFWKLWLKYRCFGTSRGTRED
jgi:hypothetical protein